MKKYTLLFLIVLFCKSVSSQEIIYVNINNTGSIHDGTTWETASLSLQDAIADAADAISKPIQIWVAEGTYKPTVPIGGSGTRFNSFELKNGVEIYGGFAGGEVSLSARDFNTHHTILSGDVDNTPDDYSGNCYHIIYNSDVSAINNSAVLDGFTITGGNSNGTRVYPGGGMSNISASPTIRNCIFDKNHGTNGSAIYNSGSSPVITNCTFTNNVATNGATVQNSPSSSPQISNCTFSGNTGVSGGALYFDDNSPLIISNCSFSNNSATSGGAIFNRYSATQVINCSFNNNSANAGGAISNTYSAIQIINCIFTRNNAVTSGGAIENYCDTETPYLTNCTFSGNFVSAAGAGPALSDLIVSGAAIVRNSIFWGDYINTPDNLAEISGGQAANYSYCCIYGETSSTYPGPGNIFIDPLFVGSEFSPDHPYTLLLNSPCIDAGYSDFCSELYDIKGDGRKLLKTDGSTTGTIDIGAYEFNSNNPLPVELVSFTANQSDSEVLLKWQTATEVNNYGFEIERAAVVGHQSLVIGEQSASGVNPQSEIRNPKWEKVGFVPGNGNSNSPKDYSFVDNLSNLSNLSNLQYRLKQIDTDGGYAYYPKTAEVNISLTGINEKQSDAGLHPDVFMLRQNYPNPFNPSTVIGYQLPVSSNVELKVYNILGNEVAELVNENQQPGYYQVRFNGENLAAGIYIYKITAGSFSASRKLLLLK